MATKRNALDQAQVVLCSACLLGEACRYDGRDKLSRSVLRALEGKEVVPVCPEVAGGLGVPRPACALEGGDGNAVLDGKARVLSKAGSDTTAAFQAGATTAIEAARRFGATVAILQERSPSCGSRTVWIGPALARGAGVTAAALEREGVTVISSDDLDDESPR